MNKLADPAFLIYPEAEKLRDLINEKLPEGSIAEEHTEDAHYYRANHFEDKPLLASATTQMRYLKDPTIGSWAVNRALDYVVDNYDRLVNGELDGVIYDAKQAPRIALERASELGTVAHDALEKYLISWIKYQTPPQDLHFFLSDDADPMSVCAARSGLEYLKSSVFVPVWSELRVASKKLQVAGTLDFLAFKGEVVKEQEKPCLNDHEFMRIKTKGLFTECVRCHKRYQFKLWVIDWKTSNQIDKAKYVLQASVYWQSFLDSIGIKAEHIEVVRIDKNKLKFEAREIDPVRRREAIKIYKKLGDIHRWMESDLSNLPAPPKKVLQL